MSWWFHGCCPGEVPPPVCTCHCACCEDNDAPCCWKVVIAGVVEPAVGGAGDCTDMNHTYYLRQDPNDDCHWVSLAGYGPTGPCQHAFLGDTVDLYVTCSNGNTVIEVSIGGNTWSKAYPSPPACCGMEDEELANTASASDCDSSSSTATISDAGDANPNCLGGGACCIASFAELTVSGFPSGPNCDMSGLNGTYLLQSYGPTSAWYYCGVGWTCSYTDPWGRNYYYRIDYIVLTIASSPCTVIARFVGYQIIPSGEGSYVITVIWKLLPGGDCEAIVCDGAVSGPQHACVQLIDPL